MSFGTRLSAILLALLLAGGAAAQTRLLRFPDLHEDRVVFCYAGDLWTAPAAGGDATRLTTHPGRELFPRFSPDGKWIAFTGQYDGDEQVYVMPSRGGVPRQLTFYPARGPLPPRWGFDNQVYGWSRDGKSVLFRSMRDGWDLTDTRLFTVSLEGGLPTPLPMPVSGGGDIAPDGKRAVYSPLTRDFRSWKRYQGGWAQDLYIFDFATNEVEQITAHPRSDRDPMWIGDRVYYCSDRDGKLNLFAFDTKTKDTIQLTHNVEFDLRWPSRANDERIIHELNGQLQVFDIAEARSKPIEIFVPDDGVASRPARKDVSRQIAGFGLSPHGKRALFVARGDLFTVPAKNGSTRNLTRSSGAHDKAASWSPDGRKIVFLSDRTGEEELWLVDQDGSGEAEQLTKGGKAMRYAPTWSPDGTRIAFSDKDGKLYVLTLADKKVVEIADDQGGMIRDYDWSPHGGHLAYSMSEPSGFRSLWIWSVADGKNRRVTSERFDESNPAFGPKGDYLFYTSEREYAPMISSSEWNYATTRTTGIYCLALRKDVGHPFPPKSDEAEIEKPKAEDKADKEKKGDAKKDDAKNRKAKAEKKAEAITIDWEGLAGRAVRVPVPFSNYGGLDVTAGGDLLFYEFGPFFYGRSSGQPSKLKIYDVKKQKLADFAQGRGGYALSADGKTLLLRKGRGFTLHKATPSGTKGEPLALKDMAVMRVPKDEWRQIFDEVWRRFRDFFYVENMHGYDWKAIGDRYRALLPHVAHRSDLNYVISEMIGELAVSHAYITGGDYEVPERAPVALPGARFTLDAKAGLYRISAIFAGENEEPKYRSPLTEVGVDAKVGDYVLAIDGMPLTAKDNPYQLLRNRRGEFVELRLNAKPEEKGARTTRYRPLSAEGSLIYRRWIERNRRMVAEATDGKVGYIHIPDMGADGIAAFIKGFYSQIRKNGLVIDVRNNGGGNVSQMIIERLRRELLATEFVRTMDRTDTYPSHVLYGHLVCLLNENSASDGDIFPAMFRQAKLGPLIGKRSWGGIIGITNRGTLIDGGTTNVPEFGNAGLTGEWIIEGYGVDPDIVVENDPKSVIEGRDPQLAKGIEVILEAIKKDPKVLPKRPADPIKTR